jgi:Spy/CpxP family protein refolding chaperone
MTKKVNALIAAALLLLLCAALSFAQTQKTNTSVHVDNDEWMMKQSGDGRDLQIKLRGKPEFTEDYSDVTALSAGGYLRVEETRGSVTRRYEAEPDGNGNLRRVYFVQGKAHAFDAEARQWLSALLLDAVRQSGLDAPRRVARLYQKGGANAVFEEIALIRGDYGKRRYLSELAKNHPLDAAAAQRIVHMAAREMSSDYEKRQALSLVAEKYLDDQQVLAEFIAALATIKSDYERGQALATVLKRGSLTKEQLGSVLQSIAALSSDYEKAQALIRVATAYPAETAASPVFFEAANSVKSDYEHSRVLLALLRGKPHSEALKLTLKSAATIHSDYEKARVLTQVAALAQDDESVRKELVEVAKSINSDYERGRVLAAAFK